MRTAVVTVTMLMVVFSLAASGREETKAIREESRAVEESRSATSDGTVTIRTYAGSVSVTGWDRAEVRVAGTLGRDIVRLDFASSGSGTAIETVPPDPTRITSKMQLSCALEVSVPASSSVRVSSLSAEVTVRDVDGAVECDTLAGRIDVAGVPGVIALRTLSGDIAVAGPASRVSFQTMGGRGAADGRGAGEVSIVGDVPEVMGSTLGGAVRIRGMLMKDYDISTLSGAIVLDGDFADDGRLKVDAGLDGSIDLTLPADVRGKFTLNCPWDRVDLKGFAPKAGIDWVFRNEEEVSARIKLVGEASGPVTIAIEPRGRVTGFPALPRITLGGSFSEFDVGSPGKARVYLEAGSLGRRSSGSNIVLKTR
jgi:hypothetical protein